ncbi:MAG: anthranilate phosphoribosyltransferase [Bryobacteraceae bacterium]|nr:anthranilate phosphoribosyltransferase [Bryobacteraceae bacterium]
MSLLPFLYRVVERENLDAIDAERAMSVILEGEASTPQVAAFLVALRMKGETSEEVLGFARAMRARATRVDLGPDCQPVLDTCGTGGDGLSTFNISTTAAFVVAGAGVRVAKHGNRSISSQCGSADVLEMLGVRLAQDAAQMAEAIRRVGIGFLFAPLLHPAVKHAQPARQELRMRTVFNLLGPLTNPAGATRQLVGAPSASAAELMAGALARLGVERAFVVHGSDGLDEITTSRESLVLEIRGGAIAHRTVSPEDFGVRRAALRELEGASAEGNAAIVREVLSGGEGPRRDVVLVNAAVALVAAGKAADFAEGMRLAAASIDSGAAMGKLTGLIAFTQPC